jgi:sec-independent protein translocase protein TatA
VLLYPRHMPNIGPMEIAIVLIIALLVLGPKRLPEMGKSVGRGMREFKNALTMSDDDDDDVIDTTKADSAKS